MLIFVLASLCAHAQSPTQASTPATEPATAAVAPVAPRLDGTWRVDMRLVNEVKVPIMGTTRLFSIQTMLATVTTQPDGTVMQRHVACSIATEGEQKIVTTIFPDSFVAALPKKTYPLKITADGAGGWSYFADLKPQYLGYDPALSPNGPPHEDDHPALVDSDHDGKPGVTAIAKAPVFGSVELYLAQNAHTHLRGTVRNNDLVEGNAPMVALDQWMVGSTNRLFHRNPEVTHRPKLSTFTMQRRPAGTTCNDLKAEG